MTKDKLKSVIKEFLYKSKNSLIIESDLSPTQLEKREEYITKLKKNKQNLVKRYGKNAEAVMYGRATNLAKKSTEKMKKEQIKELVRKALMEDDAPKYPAGVYGPGEIKFSIKSDPLAKKIVFKFFGTTDDMESKIKYSSDKSYNYEFIEEPKGVKYIKNGEEYWQAYDINGNKVDIVGSLIGEIQIQSLAEKVTKKLKK